MSDTMQQRAIHELVQSNLACLAQARELVGRLADEQYRASAPGGRGGVGPHLRHALDHYDCFLAGVAAGTIDYDQRERDLEVENSRERALERLALAEAGLLRLRTFDAAHEVTVKLDSGERHSRCASRSTLARELQFLVSHTVHHFALVAFVLRIQGVEPGPELGVAPSTLKYEQDQKQPGSAACAR
ncbi:MAG: hypothetical protein NTV21_11840 [Planctomycetota bacterium]|nr:hypothetical protein [Planctomycetota bacterium]